MITLVERPLVLLSFIHYCVLFVVVSLVAVAAIGVAVVVGDVDAVMAICAVAVDITVVAADITFVVTDVTVVAADITVVAADVTVVVMRGFVSIFFTLHILLFCSILGYFLRVVAGRVRDTRVQFSEQQHALITLVKRPGIHGLCFVNRISGLNRTTRKYARD